MKEVTTMKFSNLQYGDQAMIVLDTIMPTGKVKQDTYYITKCKPVFGENGRVYTAFYMMQLGKETVKAYLSVSQEADVYDIIKED